MIALPTTAGTGAEVTANAVLASPRDGVKASLRSPLMIPALAIVDPELALGCPRPVTASAGMDALTQCLEPYVSNRANPVTDGWARTGLLAAGRGLRRAYEDGADLAARTDLALCSLMGGLALANAKLGAVHGFASAVGGMSDAPHGAICAALLAPVCRANLAAAASPDCCSRYSDAAAWLTGDATAHGGGGGGLDRGDRRAAADPWPVRLRTDRGGCRGGRRQDRASQQHSGQPRGPVPNGAERGIPGGAVGLAQKPGPPGGAPMARFS